MPEEAIKMENTTNIVAQEKDNVNNTIDSGERTSPYTTHGVDDSWGGLSVDNYTANQDTKPSNDAKAPGLKRVRRKTKQGNTEYYVVDSQGNECLVSDNRTISSIEKLREETTEINESFGLKLSDIDVAAILGKNYEKLTRKARKRAGATEPTPSTFNWSSLEKEFAEAARLTKYQRLVKAKVPDDVIYRLILQGDKEGEVEVDLNDPSVNPFHRFASLWIEECLTIQERNYWTDASHASTFIEICKREIQYNSRSGELEWIFNGETLNWNYFISEVRNKMLAVVDYSTCPLHEATLVSKDDLKALAEEIINSNQYNPITRWAEKLPEWDGKDRYSEFLRVLGQDQTSDVAMLLFEWMKAAMNRFLLPGSVNELVPILKGKQGCRKTTASLELTPFGGTLDSLSNNPENIRIKHKMSIAELGEFNGMLSVKAVEAIKREISRTTDPLRPLYVNSTIDLPRAFSYIGTINNETFFTDTTGNRRFFVVEIPLGTKIDIDWIKENREQLWSQIKQDSNLKGWLDEKQEKIAALSNKNFTHQDDASEFVEWFCEKFTLEQLKEGRLKLEDEGNHALRVKGFLLTKIELEKVARKRMFELHGNEEKCDKQFFKNIDYLLTGKGFSYRQHRVKEVAYNAKTGTRTRYYRFEGGEII